jgi:hypothetical protein
MGIARTRREKKLLSAIGIIGLVVLLVILYLTAGFISSKPSLPPQVREVSPQGTVSSLSIVVVVQFSVQMDGGSVESAFSMVSEGKTIAGTTDWLDNYFTFTFTPASDLQDGRGYEIRLEKTALTAGGTPIDKPLTWKFYTPSIARSIGGLLPVVIISVMFLLMFFVYIEYTYYRLWALRMRKRYGPGFDEDGHDFQPLLRRKKKLKKGLIVEKGAWGVLYDNGFSANFLFDRHKSIRHEYKSYSEIEAIYPFSFGETYSRSKKMMFDGIQIETKDLKVCIFNSTLHPLKDIIPQLVSELGGRWDKVYKGSEQVDRKNLGVHHWVLEECP